jgi:hypothetical protein
MKSIARRQLSIWPAMRRMALMMVIYVLVLVSNLTSAKIPDDQPHYYLYGTEDSTPVIDYHPTDGLIDGPDFLYGLNQGPRVIEFYFHVCHHVSTSYSVTVMKIIPKIRCVEISCYYKLLVAKFAVW